MSETINQDGSTVLIEAVYYRHHCVYVEECDSVEEAQRFLDGGTEYGSLSSVGVYVDGEPHSSGPWDWHRPELGDGGREVGGMRREYARAKEAD